MSVHYHNNQQDQQQYQYNPAQLYSSNNNNNSDRQQLFNSQQQYQSNFSQNQQQQNVEMRAHNHQDHNKVGNQFENNNKHFVGEHQQNQRNTDTHQQQQYTHKQYVHKGVDEGHEQEYNALKIPADWNEANQHAESRKTGPKVQLRGGVIPQICKCCGYQVQRHDLSLSNSTIELQFLGSGFPCFYNWIKYSLVILIAFFCISGVYNIYTNTLGSFCDHDDITYETSQSGKHINIEQEMKTCHNNFAHLLSIANKINTHQNDAASRFQPTQQKLNLCTAVVIMVILMLFRRSQRKLDIEIDDAQTSPADYTIIVKNIPKGYETNYKRDLTHIFTYNAVPQEEIRRQLNIGSNQDAFLEVEKVNLVYNTDYIIELEERLAKSVKRKQEFLEKFGFRTQDPIYQDIEDEIEHIEHRIHKLEEEIPNDPQAYFSGIAFVSFKTEAQKDLVLRENEHSFSEQMESYYNEGKLQNPKSSDLTWDKHKLFIEEAPEADDIDWEFIHIDTKRKIWARVKAWAFTILFIGACYCAIWALSLFQSHMIESMYEKMGEGDVSAFRYYGTKFYSFFISMGIVLFNKFCLGKVFHIIVDTEYYSTKTKFNIAFATKLTLALFCNSALITYFVEILSSDNYYGPGGFIYTETWVFIWNCMVPPMVWFIDPWTTIKDKERAKQLKKAQSGKCYLTQDQANKLMEKVEYTQGKRYADMMKTMWFTFFYAPCIPLGLVFSMISLIFYFWVDFYNVIKRRTIKETLSKDVSIEMIENLEISLLWFAIGNVTFAWQLFGTLDYTGIIQLVIALIYAVLPMQEINEWLFPLDSKKETLEFKDAEANFMTDYDRQNPITKKFALKRFQQLLQNYYQNNNNGYTPQGNNNYDNPYAHNNNNPRNNNQEISYY